MLLLSIFIQQKAELRKDHFSVHKVAAGRAEVTGHEEPDGLWKRYNYIKCQSHQQKIYLQILFCIFSSLLH